MDDVIDNIKKTIQKMGIDEFKKTDFYKNHVKRTAEIEDIIKKTLVYNLAYYDDNIRDTIAYAIDLTLKYTEQNNQIKHPYGTSDIRTGIATAVLGGVGAAGPVTSSGYYRPTLTPVSADQLKNATITDQEYYNPQNIPVYGKVKSGV